MQNIALRDFLLEDFVNLDRFPIHMLESPRRESIVEASRVQLREFGCAHLPRFLTDKTITSSIAMAERLEPMTFRASGENNPYYSAFDDALYPEDHPVRRRQRNSQGFIGSDYLDPLSALSVLFAAPAFTAFVSDCLEFAPIYPSADPIARMPISVQRPGDSLPWHFDGNEFTVTLALQAADEGGVFEYVPNIRSPENENYEAVQAILDGDRTGVRSLKLAAGDLQIFKGRFSLHRATEVLGKTTRFIAAPAWTLTPDWVNTVQRSISGYGRATDQHYAKQAERQDHLLG